LRTIPPITLAAIRASVGFVVLAAIAGALRHPVPRDARSWRALILIGLFGGAIPFSLMALAQERIESSLAAIFITTMPLFTLGLAHLFTDDRASPRKLVGVMLGFVGILMLLGPAALSGQGGSVLGQVLMAGVALSYSVMSVIIRRMGAGAGTVLSRTACGNFAAAVMLLPLAFLAERPLAMEPSAVSVLGALGVGLCASTIGQFLVFRLSATVGPNFVAANNYLAPPVGVVWGVLLLGEEITWLRVAAMLVIFLGIAFATTRGGVVRFATR
jgi:drug/metabolite transporter (DMT)-like permease